MAFWNLDTIKLEEFRPGILSKAEIGDNLIMVCMEIDPNKEDTGHVHAKVYHFAIYSMYMALGAG